MPFMSANKTGSKESMMRFEAYKAALAENGLKYDENLHLNGDFSHHGAVNLMQQKYPKKEDLDFDAILCGNDLMALGCQQYLLKIGVKIPDEIKIIGFDDSTYAAQSHPRLSTMNQNIFMQGSVAAEEAYKILENKSESKVFTVPVIPLYKQSCGCIPLKNNDDVFRNAQDRLIHSDLHTNGIYKMTDQFYKSLNSVESIYRLLDLSQTTETLHHFANTLDRILNELNIPSCLVCFYKKPVMLDQGKEFILPHNATVAMMLDTERKVHDYDPGIEFNPAKNPFPDEYFNGYPGSFIIHPLFSGRKNYGYIVCKITTSNYSIHSLVVKILINTISSNYEYTRSLTKSKSLSKINQTLQQSNSTLDLQSKTDELTKILNRRGFMELGQKTIDIAMDVCSHGLLFFADLDGLKKINDTYGHDMGDEAIKAAAEVLAHSLRSNDTVGRLSGDEFAAIAVGMPLSKEQKFREKIETFCEAISKDRNLPFTLSMSVGTIEFNQDNKDTSLSELLSLADEKLYIEKRKKHKKR